MGKAVTTSVARESRPGKQARALEVFRRLLARYSDARCTLDFKDPLQLLVATILAAQCTDERVNLVTKSLFRRFRTAQDYLDAPVEELEEAIRSCGFYRQKAKSIRQTCRALIDRFGGKVPGTMEELLTLNGVGRKTANVILGECFNTPGIIVDTHCTRLTRRLGFTRHTEPAKIEQDMMNLIPREHWRMFSHCLVFHGRNVCNARAPLCSQCVVNDLCPFPRSAAGRKIAK